MDKFPKILYGHTLELMNNTIFLQQQIKRCDVSPKMIVLRILHSSTKFVNSKKTTGRVTKWISIIKEFSDPGWVARSAFDICEVGVVPALGASGGQFSDKRNPSSMNYASQVLAFRTVNNMRIFKMLQLFKPSSLNDHDTGFLKGSIWLAKSSDT